MTFKFPLATSSWDEEEIKAIQRVIASNQYSMGPEVSSFENDFANFFGAKYAIMVNSGSSANLLMTAALFYSQNKKLKLMRGDEIIVPAVSWSTTFFPLQQYGLHLKFVDIDLTTLNYDLEALSDAIGPKTRAIMAVNLLGNPNDFGQIAGIIDNKDIILIEDNCESMGATYKNKYTGTFGVMGSFSCFFSHHISTMEGGVIVTDEEELFHILLALRAHGWTRNLPKFNKVTTEKSDNDFEESFRFILPGYNLRPLEMSGAIGKVQLEKLPKIIAGRQNNAKLFKAKMRNKSNFIIQNEIGISSWFGFSLIVSPECTYDRTVLQQRLNNLGFECRPIVSGNFAKNDVIQYFDYSIHDELKNAKYLDKNGLFIGNHHYCIEEAIDALDLL